MVHLQEQNPPKDSDPAFKKEKQETCENEAFPDKTDRVDVGEEGTTNNEVIDQEVGRNSLMKVAKMKKNAGALTKKSKEKVPKQMAWDRFSRTSSKVPLFLKRIFIQTWVCSLIGLLVTLWP